MLYESSYYGIAGLGDDSLQHHGIKGMSWGKRNGPPYPLSAAKHRAVVKGNDKNVRYGASDTRTAQDMDHSKSSYTKQVARLAIDVGVGIITLNPLAAANAMSKIHGAVRAHSLTTKVDKLLAKNDKVDKKTGLKLKQKDMNENQDAKMVNPGFKNFNDNTKNNCMLCTATYEMRRRGYDVTANKASFGYTSNDVKRWFPKAEVKNISYKPDRMEAITHSALSNATINERKKQGNGARGNLMVQWDYRAGGGGHSMVYEVHGDNVVIRCTQSNRTYKNPRKILKRCQSVSYARLDNVDFNAKTIKEVCRS